MGDLAVLAGRGGRPVGGAEPDADGGEAKDEAEEPAAEADADDGEHGQPVPSHRRQRVPVQVLVPGEGAGIEPRRRPRRQGAPRGGGSVGEEHGDGAGEAVVGDVEGGEADEEAELVGDGAGELVGVEIYDVEVGAGGELPRDGAGEGVGGEVEHGEVEQLGELRRDGPGQRVGGEVQRLEVGAVGELRRDGAGEGETREGELVDAAVVAGDAMELGDEAFVEL